MIAAAELLAASALPRAEARALLAQVLSISRERLVAFPETAVASEAAARFDALAARRRSGEPLAYLVGTQEFYGRPFKVSPAVLIPRPDTETLVEVALACMRDARSPRVLELGTGTGCIAITLKLERPDAIVMATDVSADALAVARSNACALGAGVAFKASRWFDAIAATELYDLIVSNPPYVAAEDPHLADLGHEPALALTDGADGLSCLAAIARQAPGHLATQGWLALEHGFDQATAVVALLRDSGLHDVQVSRDAAGHERVTRGRR
ncbi:MAG TPA: peptide chain release factor N(5)-glutamine methyltransferase [Burkholderiaceae bacterium]|nr:peptide chain release factor N(5)-glutamine methyltransferase [Burkholderiaceae bacterium]HQR70427.1 peptide chain release factor N(5)-glutamine methyltransferase [Burkholderiaceae bacterium]